MKKIAKLKAHQDASEREKFGKRLMKLIPELKPYVRHRLYLAESLEIIPENMYRSTDIIDDAVVNLYESDISTLQSDIDLKIRMFKLVKKNLDDIFKKEAWHQDSISTDKILHQELNKLRTRFAYDVEEYLTDISYKQKDFTPQLFLFDDAEQNVKTAFDLDYLNEERKRAFAKLYRFLSIEASNVVDLHVFGKLNSSEIAQIKNTDEQQIRDIILQVKDGIYKIITHNMENEDH
jgi:DNA-directed RNA polymerase specialized sigma24 family protein